MIYNFTIYDLQFIYNFTIYFFYNYVAISNEQ